MKRRDLAGERKPHWLKVQLPTGERAGRLRRLIEEKNLHTVCQSARCPNRGECWSRGTATFMILGNICTRACGFCAVPSGFPGTLDAGEPRHVAEAVATLELEHAVVTSVNRDDLPDGGAAHFVATIEAIRALNPGTTIEVLTPDFDGNWAAVDAVVGARPDLYNHNLETVPRLYPRARPRAAYRRSLRLLARVKQRDSSIFTKSGIMVGLGEREDELDALMDDLLAVGCDVLTIGQYLRPSVKHMPVAAYVTPEQFDAYASRGRAKGFLAVYAGPLVRSSYNADDLFARLWTLRRQREAQRPPRSREQAGD